MWRMLHVLERMSLTALACQTSIFCDVRVAAHSLGEPATVRAETWWAENCAAPRLTGNGVQGNRSVCSSPSVLAYRIIAIQYRCKD